MPSFKVNFALVKGTSISNFFSKMLEYGCPENTPSGVLKLKTGMRHLPGASDPIEVVSGSLVFAKKAKVKKVDRKTKNITDKPIDKDDVVDFCIYPNISNMKKLIIEVYGGGYKSVMDKIQGLFNTVFVATSITSERVMVDIGAVDHDVDFYVSKLQGLTSDCKVKSASIRNYEADSGITGNYTSRFTDSATGVDFIEQQGEKVATASLAYTGGGGKVNVKLSNTPCFSFSCKEEDREEALDVLRQIAGLPKVGVLAGSKEVDDEKLDEEQEIDGEDDQGAGGDAGDPGSVGSTGQGPQPATDKSGAEAGNTA